MYDIMFLDGCLGVLEVLVGIRGFCVIVGKRFFKFMLFLEFKL